MSKFKKAFLSEYRFKKNDTFGVLILQLHTTEFNTNCALHELYTYAMKYNEQLTVTLEEDEFSQKQRLAYKLEQVGRRCPGAAGMVQQCVCFRCTT